MLRDLVLCVTTFVVVTALAVALGAHNVGTAATLGQIAFIVCVVAVMVRR